MHRAHVFTVSLVAGTEEIAGGTQVSASQHLTHASAQQGVRQPAAGQEPGSGDPVSHTKNEYYVIYL